MPFRWKVVPDTPSSAAIQKGLINSRRAGFPAQGFHQSFDLIGKVQPDVHAPVRVDGDGLQQFSGYLSGQRRNPGIAFEMLDYSIAAVVAAAYFVLQLQDRAGDFLCLRRQSFLLRREALAGAVALYQSFIEVSQPLVKLGFPTLEGLQLSLRLFAVKLSRLLSCLQEPVYADGVLSVDLY